MHFGCHKCDTTEFRVYWTERERERESHGMLGAQSISQSLCTRFVDPMIIFLRPTVMNAHCLIMLLISVVKSPKNLLLLFFLPKTHEQFVIIWNWESLVRKGHQVLMNNLICLTIIAIFMVKINSHPHNLCTRTAQDCTHLTNNVDVRTLA